MTLCATRRFAFLILGRIEHSGFVSGYNGVKKVQLILNQIQQFLTTRNSKFFLLFRQNFRHLLLADFTFWTSSLIIPCTTDVDMLRITAICWMLNRQSERKTSRTWFTFSSLLAVIGRPERGSATISSQLSLSSLVLSPELWLPWRPFEVSRMFGDILSKMHT